MVNAWCRSLSPVRGGTAPLFEQVFESRIKAMPKFVNPVDKTHETHSCLCCAQ